MIEIELKYKLCDKDDLCEIDYEREALFVFNNGQIFFGHSDGDIDTDENDEETFGIKKENARFALCMPYDRLIGWAYVDERVITDDVY